MWCLSLRLPASNDDLPLIKIFEIINKGGEVITLPLPLFLHILALQIGAPLDHNFALALICKWPVPGKEAKTPYIDPHRN